MDDKINKKIKVKNYKEYFKDSKSIFTIFCITIAFILVILLSSGVSFYFRGLDDSFWGDLAISFSLCVYCLYFGIPEGSNIYEKKKDGRYQKALLNFLSCREQTSKRDNDFNQWLDNYYQKNKLDYYKIILSTHGNINPYVLDLDYYELEKLRKPYKKNWEDTEFKGREETYFRSLNDNQIEIIKSIFNGEVNVEKIPNDFFKTLNGKIIESEYVEQAKTNKKNTLKYALLIGYRIIFVFVFAFVFSIFGYQVSEASGSGEVMQRTITTISRLWTMISSFVYGLAVGKIVVMNKAVKLEYKARVSEYFLNDKTFVYLNEEEIAKKEYEEYQKNVKEPEIVETNENKDIKLIE